MVKFLRRTWSRYSKLGKGRKKKQVWRKPTGRHNKMREQTKGAAAIVSIGYGSNKDSRGKLMGKTPVAVHNLKDLEKIKKEQIAVLSHVGKKKKIEIAKKAKEMKIEVYNLNPEKFLKLNMKNPETKTKQKTGNFLSSSSGKSQTEERKK